MTFDVHDGTQPRGRKREDPGNEVVRDKTKAQGQYRKSLYGVFRELVVHVECGCGGGGGFGGGPAIYSGNKWGLMKILLKPETWKGWGRGGGGSSRNITLL